MTNHFSDSTIFRFPKQDGRTFGIPESSSAFQAEIFEVLQMITKFTGPNGIRFTICHPLSRREWENRSLEIQPDKSLWSSRQKKAHRASHRYDEVKHES